MLATIVDVCLLSTFEGRLKSFHNALCGSMAITVSRSDLFYTDDDGVSHRGRRMSSGLPLLPVNPRVTDEANSCGKLSAAVVTDEGSCTV